MREEVNWVPVTIKVDRDNWTNSSHSQSPKTEKKHKISTNFNLYIIP